MDTPFCSWCNASFVAKSGPWWLCEDCKNVPLRGLRFWVCSWCGFYKNVIEHEDYLLCKRCYDRYQVPHVLLSGAFYVRFANAYTLHGWEFTANPEYATPLIGGLALEGRKIFRNGELRDLQEASHLYRLGSNVWEK